MRVCRIVCLFLAASILLLGFPWQSAALSSDEIEERIEELERQGEQLQEQIDALEAQLDQTQSDMQAMVQ